ncbi:MAG TPA: hypothetical protein VGR84_16930 [Candidatus Acidoferrales bacterium]|nr:hypothetical protein [Candidatus Acidoferrales bacterium]
MTKKVTSILVASAFALALSLPVATSAEPGLPAAKAPTAKALTTAAQDRDDRERHPEIRDAIGLLNRAQDRLNHAAHDFHGHRVKAMQHISEALEELHKAQASDRH